MIHRHDPRKRATDDVDWLMRAIQLSRCCPKSDRSFAVGAILVDTEGNELATGFSLELGAGFHAEEVAISKATQSHADLRGSTIYTSLEPCSVRLSGKRPCVYHIIEAGIVRAVYALAEPPVFVQCNGDQVLRRHGMEVVALPDLAPLVQEVNAHLLTKGTR